MTDLLANQLQDLPTEPGIYKYFNTGDELLYVGKAVNLKNRVRSYFQDKNVSPKTRVLVEQIARLETIVVRSEVDALILEANLIKEHKPRYNIILKDDKSHLYIKITVWEDFPRVSTCRGTDQRLDGKAVYFGPYPSGMTVKSTLRKLRRIFPYVSCRRQLMEGKPTPERPCLYHNLGLCPAPCTGTLEKRLYRQQIFQLIRFLEGKRQSVVDDLEKQMKASAKALAFEDAGRLKKQLSGIVYMTQQQISPSAYLSNPELLQERRAEGLQTLAAVLQPFYPSLVIGREGDEEEASDDAGGPRPLHRVECYDISNISGEQAVGSMVVFEDGEPIKSDYRKFRIRLDEGPNDVAMLSEVLRRRFARLRKAQEAASAPESVAMGQLKTDDLAQATDHEATAEIADAADETAGPPPAKAVKVDASFAATPDLIIVDGGKPQLAAAMVVLAELSLPIPVIGIAKREEELLVPPPQDGGLVLEPEDGELHGHPSGADKVRLVVDEPLASEDASLGANEPLRASTGGRVKRSGAHGAVARTAGDAAVRVTAEQNFTTVRLARGSESLFFIQRLRDEAHRFAITYHRKVRGKAFLPK